MTKGIEGGVPLDNGPEGTPDVKLGDQALQPNQPSEARGWAYARAVEAGLHDLVDDTTYTYDYVGAWGNKEFDLTRHLTGAQIKEMWETSISKGLHDIEKRWREGANSESVFCPPQALRGEQKLVITKKNEKGSTDVWTVVYKIGDDLGNFDMQNKKPVRVRHLPAKENETYPREEVSVGEESVSAAIENMPTDIRSDLDAFPWDMLEEHLKKPHSGS
jgi:hypothetical protein